MVTLRASCLHTFHTGLRGILQEGLPKLKTVRCCQRHFLLFIFLSIILAILFFFIVNYLRRPAAFAHVKAKPVQLNVAVRFTAISGVRFVQQPLDPNAGNGGGKMVSQ